MEIRIVPQKSSVHSIKELFGYKELFYLLALRDIKVRYKQTLLGIIWVIFQPLILTLIFTLFFNKIANISTNGIPYILFSFSGLIFWNFFSVTLNDSSNSLINNQSLVTKVYFPRLIIPVSAIIAGLLDFFVSFIFIFPLIFILKPSLNILGFLSVIPALVIVFMLLSGLGLFFSMLNAKFRDVRYALPFLIQLLLFLTPVIYPINLVSEKFRFLLFINPITSAIEIFRYFVFGYGQLNYIYILISIAVSFLILLSGYIFFLRNESEIADRI